jgi:D-alanine-D-alanine ligase
MSSNVLNIAIITGGNVAERPVSLKSAVTVAHHLDSSKYRKFVLELNGTHFSEQSTGLPVDLNDFSLTDTNGERVCFDLAYLILHGHPAEDGRLQGYLELMGIPYTGCDPLVSALTFDKQACKGFLHAHSVPMAPSQIVYRSQPYNKDALLEMGLPLFVKPNKNGSSFGVSKVNNADGLDAAIEKAFGFDDEVLVEGFLNGREFSNGVFRKDGQIIVLPITEIISYNEFFDYQAKYEQQSKEVTPAELSPGLAQKCQEQTRRIYAALGCRGICRFDYILVDDTFFFLEANTIPGMSEASIVPQQATAFGISLSALLDAAVNEALEVHRRIS